MKSELLVSAVDTHEFSLVFFLPLQIMNFVLAYLRRQFPNTPTVNTSDFSEIIKDNDNVLILDCRRADEHEISKIPGAKNVHFRCSDEELKETLKEVDDKTQIISYCSLGYRSAIITDRIREQIQNDSSIQANSDNVYNLEGSIFKWANENRPLIDSNDQSTR